MRGGEVDSWLGDKVRESEKLMESGERKLVAVQDLFVGGREKSGWN